MNSNRSRILHIISSLDDGGAEAVLYRMTTSGDGSTHKVISFLPGGKYKALLESQNIAVDTLDMRPNRIKWHDLKTLIKLIKDFKPNVVQTWMYHADFLGGIAAKLAGVKNISWGIHTSTLNRTTTKRSTIILSKINTVLSYFIPSKIISCSERAAVVHKGIGFAKKKVFVAPNGYNINEFAINATSRTEIRNEFAIADDALLLGMVARYDPQKDHANLIAAAGIMKNEGIHFSLLLVGSDLDTSNERLLALIENANIVDETILVGQRTDIPKIMNGLDIHVLSSSYGEAFPNVICEAMACGTVCVATDIGDCDLIIGDTGVICPPDDAQKLADAIQKAIPHAKDTKAKNKARNRIVDNFSIQAMVDKYHKIWMSK